MQPGAMGIALYKISPHRCLGPKSVQRIGTGSNGVHPMTLRDCIEWKLSRHILEEVRDSMKNPRIECNMLLSQLCLLR